MYEFFRFAFLFYPDSTRPQPDQTAAWHFLFFLFSFPRTVTARPDGVRDIFRFPSFFARWQPWHAQTVCVTFFVILYCLPMMFTARPWVWHFLFSLKFWPFGRQGQTRRRAWHFLFSPLFCRWWPRPDHMACLTFFCSSFKFWPIGKQGQTRRCAWHFLFFPIFCQWRSRPDRERDIICFSFKFWRFGRQVQTRQRAWHFSIFPLFLPMTNTARPYGVLDNFRLSLKSLPIGKQGQTRWRAWHFSFVPLFSCLTFDIFCFFFAPWQSRPDQNGVSDIFCYPIVFDWFNRPSIPKFGQPSRVAPAGRACTLSGKNKN